MNWAAIVSRVEDTMGLAVEVGVLAYLNDNDEEGAQWLRESFRKLNSVLEDKCLPRHDEPEALPPMESRAPIGSYPYSFLHHLRRFAAHATRNPKWKPTPFPESEDAGDDPVLESEYRRETSHLLLHSDCEGFYLPVDF